jgi:hypothetical protein
MVDRELSYSGIGWEQLSPQDKQAEKLAALVLKRKTPMPQELRNASMEEVRAYLKKQGNKALAS